MAIFANIFDWVMAAGLASARLVGIFLVFPIFTWLNLTPMLRTTIAFAICFPVTMTLAPQVGQIWENSPMLLLGLSVKETIIGIALGLLLSLPVIAAQLSGELVDEVRGVQNPVSDTIGQLEGPGVMSLFMFLMCMGLFFVGGGLNQMITALYDSFVIWPPNSFGLEISKDMPMAVLRFLDATFKSGFVLSLPLLLPIFITHIGIAFGARGLRGLDIEHLSLNLKSLVLLCILVIYSIFVFDSIRAATTQLGSPLDHLRKLLTYNSAPISDGHGGQ